MAGRRKTLQICAAIEKRENDEEKNDDYRNFCGGVLLLSSPVEAEVQQPYLDHVASYEDIEELMSFTLEGDEYSLPVTVDALRQNGWEFKYSSDEIKTIAGYTVCDIQMIKDLNEEKEVTFTFLNGIGDAIEAKDARVVGVEVDENDGVSFALESGLTFGATGDEVKAVYGDSSGSTWYSYRFSEELQEDDWLIKPFIAINTVKANSDRTYFDMNDNGAVSAISIEYYKTSDLEDVQVSERPSYLDAYEAPNGIENTMDKMTFSLDGADYKLPVPASKLLDSGWTFEKEQTVGGYRGGSATMIKGDHSIEVLYHNYDEHLVSINDTMITEVSLANMDEATERELFYTIYGLNDNSSIADVKKAFPELDEIKMKNGYGSLYGDELDYIISEYSGESSHTYEIEIRNDEAGTEVRFEWDIRNGKTLTDISVSGTQLPE